MLKLLILHCILPTNIVSAALHEHYQHGGDWQKQHTIRWQGCEIGIDVVVEIGHASNELTIFITYKSPRQYSVEVCSPVDQDSRL